MRFAALLVFAFVGCTRTTEVLPFEVANAAKACEGHGGWAVIWPSDGGRCSDGHYFNYKTLKGL